MCHDSVEGMRDDRAVQHARDTRMAEQKGRYDALFAAMNPA